MLQDLGFAEARPDVHFPTEPRQRIAVASYPFREFIPGPDHNPSARTVELKDFAAHVAEKFDVHRIEPWSAHFSSTETKHLEEIRKGIEKAKSGVANIAVDGEHSQYATDRAERQQAIDLGKKWVDVAVVIGSPSIRTNIPEAKDSQPDLDRAADSLREVVDYSSRKNVVVHLENDNPASEDPFFLVKLVEKVNSPWLHPLPDFGNSLAHRDANYAYRGIQALFDHAYGICHVKKRERSDTGAMVEVDMARTFGILKASRYRGYLSMEFDSAGDVYQGTNELIQDTLRYLSPKN
ncbi:MAG TPA: TIM barrel protein [Terriglobales bacterium]|jgi:sugar phosphate isomerase/epimerase